MSVGLERFHCNVFLPFPWITPTSVLRQPAKQNTLWHPVVCHSNQATPISSIRSCFHISPPSPHFCHGDVSDHCCLLEKPRMILIHLWWNEFNFLLCLFREVQHSTPYSNTSKKQALYILFLIDKRRFLSMKTAFLRAHQSLC